MLDVTEESKTAQSQQLFQKAQHYIPGGVNSPVRAFKSVGGTPRFIKSASGATITDADNVQYIDYVGSWGPMILGHAHPSVVKAVQNTASQGLSFGAPCELEVLLAEKVTNFFPSIDKVRMVNSGTEATMSAIRLARGTTGRDKLIKFVGCYHGHSDCLLVKAGSGALTFGAPSSPGVPANTAQDTLTATFNDLDSVSELFEKNKGEIAAIIVEPIAGNMNMIPPRPGFLEGLREMCDQEGALLIFDEVMTGFRVARGGAQELYGVCPDLTTLGKVIGGGMPIGAFGGRPDVMDQLAPEGFVYQAGTLSGNPVAMAAGIATLTELEAPNFYSDLRKSTQQLVDGLLERAHVCNVPLTANYATGMFGLFFSDQTVSSYAQACASKQEHFKLFFNQLLENNIYIAPSAFEAGFVSSAHTPSHIEATFLAAEKAFQVISKQ